MSKENKVDKKTTKKFLSSVIIIIALSLGLNQCSTVQHINKHGIEQEYDDSHNHEHDHEHDHEHEENNVPNNNEINENEKVEQEMEFAVPNIGCYDGDSLKEALEISGYEYSFDYCSLIAKYFDVNDYKGTEEQETELLNLLKEYAKQNSANHEHNFSILQYFDENFDLKTCEKCGATVTQNHAYSLISTNYVMIDENQHETQSIYECTNCENIKTLKLVNNHSFTPWTNNGDGTETQECPTCGYTTTREIPHNHAFGEWKYYNDEKEVRTCACGEKEYRNHHYKDTPTKEEYKINENNGTHTLIKTYTCTTCNHDKEVTQTTKHEYSKEAIEFRFVNNDNGTHQVFGTFECICGDTTEKLIKENENCKYGPWVVSANGKTQTKTCEDCGHEVTEKLVHEHILNETPLRTELEPNNNNKHNIYEVYECTSCHEEVKKLKQKNVNCTYEWSYQDDEHEIGICECGNVKTRNHTLPSKWTYNPITGKDERTCRTCHHTFEREHEHSLNEVAIRIEIESNSNGTHDIYEVYECTTCHEEIKILKQKNVTCTYGDWIVSEDGKTQTKTCESCGHKVVEEIAHEHAYGEWEYYNDYQEVRTCACGEKEVREHSYQDTPIKEEYKINTNDDTHSLIKTYRCTTCNHDKEVTQTSKHEYLDEAKEIRLINNENGTHQVIGTFECICGNEKEKLITNSQTCTYEWSYQNDEYEKGICECGSAKTRSHTLPNIWTYNAQTGKDERTCTTCNHKFEREHEHSLSSNVIKTEIESNSNGTHDIYETRKCTTCHEEVRTLKQENVTCTYEWSYQDDEYEKGICECGNVKTRSHSLPSAWIYNETTGKDERTCTTCNHKFEREHEHSLSSEVIRTEIESNTNGTHNIYEIYECTSCHQEVKKLKQENVTCTYEWSYQDDQTEKGICECGNVKTRSHSLPSAWTYNAQTGKDERTCRTCSHKFEREHEHSLSSEVIKTEIEPNLNGTHDIYETRECTTCHEEVRIIKEENVTCTYVWTYLDADYEKGICECGNIKTRSHTLPNEWTYNAETGKDERTCSTCNHKFERDHEHSTNSELIRTEIESNSNGTHNIYEVHECTICHNEVKELKQANVNCDYSNHYEYVNNDAEYAYCECGHRIAKGHNLSGEWTFNIVSGYDEQVCSNCNHTIIRVHTHQYGPEFTRIEVVEGNENQHYIITEKTCSSCRQIQVVSRELVNHTYGNWTYDPENQTETRTCSDCGNVESRTHEHSYNGWTTMDDEGATKVCTTPGCNHVVNHSHTYGTPEVTAEGALIYTCTDESCRHQKTIEHEHNYTAGLTWQTNNPNDYCTKITYTCACGDEYNEGVSHHTWEEDWLDPSLEMCTGCGIFREKIPTTMNNLEGDSHSVIYKEEDKVEETIKLTLKK